MKKTFILLVVACLSLSSFAEVKIIYCKADGSSLTTVSGLKWDSAVSLSRARSIANFYNTQTPAVANQIWMKAGTYDLTAAFSLTYAMNIYGGFTGTETDLSQRNWVSNPTIINQTGALQVIWGNLELDVLLDGLILQGGNPTGNGACGQIAAGTTLRNCIIRNNKAVTAGKFSALITMVPVGSTKKITIDNCLVVNNETAIAPSFINIVAGTLIDITNTTIANNLSEASGASTGAVIAQTDGSSTLNLKNSIIYNNKTASAAAQSVSGTTMTTGFKVLENNAWDVVPANATTLAANKLLTASPFVAATAFVGVANGTTQLLTAINAANFQLVSGSSCINAGNSSFVTGTTDFAGTPRIQGSAVDMGAYEFSTISAVQNQMIENPLLVLNNHLVVPTQLIGKSIFIYNSQGQLVQKIEKASSLNDLKYKGVLLVKVDTQAYKLINQ